MSTCLVRTVGYFYGGNNSADAEWRLGLRNVWKTSPLHQCNLFDLFEPSTLKVLSSKEKHSESTSIIMFGTMLPPVNYRKDVDFLARWKKLKCDVAIKVSFPDLEATVERKLKKDDEFIQFPSNSVSMEDLKKGLPKEVAEIKLYEYLTLLLEDHITPNLMAFYGVWNCTIGELQNQNFGKFDSRPFYASDQDVERKERDIDARKTRIVELQKVIDQGINVDLFTDTITNEKKQIAKLEKDVAELKKRVEPDRVFAKNRNYTSSEKDRDSVTAFFDEIANIYENQPYYPVDVFPLDDRITFTVLEKGRGSQLTSLINNLDNEISEVQLLSVVFQTLYTIAVLSERGVRHGDLHIGNVFVDFIRNETSLAYYWYRDAVDLQFAQFTTSGVLVKLFDWDFGSIASVPFQPKSSLHWPKEEIRNKKADSNCDRLSSCNYNPKADAFTFLASLYDQIKDIDKYSRVAAFIKRHINESLLTLTIREDFNTNVGGFPSRLCDGPIQKVESSSLSSTSCTLNVVQKKCEKAWIPEDCIVSSITSMLFDPVFANYWKSAKDNVPSTPFVYGNWPSAEERTRILTLIADKFGKDHRKRLENLGLLQK